MSEAYEKFMKKRDEGKKKVVGPKFNLHKISFDDSDQSERSDIPNIFLDQKSEIQSPKSPIKEQKQKKPNLKMDKQQSLQELNFKKSTSTSPAKRIQPQISEIQMPSTPPNQIAEAEVQIEPNSSLSLFQTIKLHLGQYLFRNTFPMKKAIYLNNNNDEQNQINKRQFLNKFQSSEQKQILYYDNSLRVGTFLFTSILLLRNIFTYFYIYAWLAVIILQFVAESQMSEGTIQYGTSKTILIVVLIIAIFIQLIADYISVKKRRSWQQNRNMYRVYYHNGHMAEWVNIKAHQIKPGHVYKVLPGEYFPTDSVIIHSENSLLYIRQGHIITQLVEYPSQFVIKQSLIKSQNVSLPLSGCLTYEISNPQYSDFQIVGKLNLLEPAQITYPVSMQNICLRGSISSSSAEILCLAMQTGIDSILMKSIQYPFQQRKTYEYSTPHKYIKISDQFSQQIQDHESTLMGCPLEKKIQSSVSIFIFVYLFLTGFSVLVHYIYKATISNQYYLNQNSILIWKIVIYHFTNYVILIPVMLIPIYKLYLAISVKVTQFNISKRVLNLTAQSDKRRTQSFSQTNNNQKQQLLDNRKIIFPVKIKDYNIIPELGNTDIIVTTIDTFRDQSAFTLHSIRVKQINHNFMTGSLDNELYSIEDIQLIKYFMSVALLTTSKTNSQNQTVHYQSGIEFAAKKYLDLKKNKNAHGETLVNGDQFKVKYLFSIRPIHQYPYKVTFLQPVTQSNQQNGKVLVLIRGNAKTILDKTYGKQIKLTEQSRKLQEEKGHHVQLVAKLTLNLSDALEIQKAYTSSNITHSFFYKNLDKYISKVQPMGLLIFVNQFYQKKIGESLRNPVLNKSLINQSRIQKDTVYTTDMFASQHLPKMIILAPLSRSAQPQYQAIHTITQLLINPYLFNFSLSEVADKIIHQKPSNIEKMIDQLEEQRILVWNGWDQKDTIYTIDILKRYGKKILFYTEKDEYMYLMKESNYSVKGSRNGYDSGKFSDISLTSKSSVSYLYLTQLISYDSVVIRQGILSILSTQISKLIFYLVIELIHIFYTRGTGLTIIKSSFYIIIEFVLILDVLYYINCKDSMRCQTFQKTGSFLKLIFVKILQTVLQGIFITFVCLYSLEVPSNIGGTSQSYHFSHFAIIFTIFHVLIIEKIFNYLSFSLSIFRFIIIAAQIVLLYIGFVVVSSTDTYQYFGIVSQAIKGKWFMTVTGCLWICLTLPAVRALWTLMKNKNLRKAERVKKTF